MAVSFVARTFLIWGNTYKLVPIAFPGLSQIFPGIEPTSPTNRPKEASARESPILRFLLAERKRLIAWLSACDRKILSSKASREPQATDITKVSCWIQKGTILKYRRKDTGHQHAALLTYSLSSVARRNESHTSPSAPDKLVVCLLFRNLLSNRLCWGAVYKLFYCRVLHNRPI